VTLPASSERALTVFAVTAGDAGEISYFLP